MTVSVLLFASYADMFGTRLLNVPVNTPCAIADLVQAMRRLPGGDGLPQHPVVAVNRKYTRDFNYAIGESDEVAVIPPVAGG